MRPVLNRMKLSALKLTCLAQLTNFGFRFILRRYNLVFYQATFKEGSDAKAQRHDMVGQCRVTPD